MCEFTFVRETEIVLFVLCMCAVGGVVLQTAVMIQTHKKFKRTLFIRTKTRNLQIFGLIPFVKLQNET